ncbi:zinc finger domain-containing protein [Streptosporangium sp. NPDC004631]
MTTRKIVLTRDQVIDLLTCAAAYDRRTIGETDVAAWTLAIGDLPYDDAQAAIVGHYSESTDWLMPAHVRTRVRQARERNIARHPVPELPADPDDPAAYRAELKAAVAQLANGMQAPRPLAIGSGAPPTDEYTRARGLDRHPLRLAAKKVVCPWPACRAGIGTACVNASGRRLDQPAHDARLVAAELADWVEVADGVHRAVLRGQDVAS